jgi:hypothetical protein
MRARPARVCGADADVGHKTIDKKNSASNTVKDEGVGTIPIWRQAPVSFGEGDYTAAQLLELIGSPTL